MKTETIVGYILAVLALLVSTIVDSAEILGISQQAVLIISLGIGFFTSAWEMFQRLPKSEAEKQAKSFARYYKGEFGTMERKDVDSVNASYKLWKELK